MKSQNITILLLIKNLDVTISMRRIDREKADLLAKQQQQLNLSKLKKVILEGCQEDKHPQQTEYETDELTLDSCFDSGNMLSAIKVEDQQVSKHFFFLVYSIIFTLLLTVQIHLLKQDIEHGFISGLQTLKNLDPILSSSRT